MAFQLPKNLPPPSNDDLIDVGKWAEQIEDEQAKAEIKSLVNGLSFESLDTFVDFLESKNCVCPQSWGNGAGSSGLLTNDSNHYTQSILGNSSAISTVSAGVDEFGSMEPFPEKPRSDLELFEYEDNLAKILEDPTGEKFIEYAYSFGIEEAFVDEFDMIYIPKDVDEFYLMLSDVFDISDGSRIEYSPAADKPVVYKSTPHDSPHAALESIKTTLVDGYYQKTLDIIDSHYDEGYLTVENEELRGKLIDQFVMNHMEPMGGVRIHNFAVDLFTIYVQDIATCGYSAYSKDSLKQILEHFCGLRGDELEWATSRCAKAFDKILSAAFGVPASQALFNKEFTQAFPPNAVPMADVDNPLINLSPDIKQGVQSLLQNNDAALEEMARFSYGDMDVFGKIVGSVRSQKGALIQAMRKLQAMDQPSDIAYIVKSFEGNKKDVEWIYDKVGVPKNPDTGKFLADEIYEQMTMDVSRGEFGFQRSDIKKPSGVDEKTWKLSYQIARERAKIDVKDTAFMALNIGGSIAAVIAGAAVAGPAGAMVAGTFVAGTTGAVDVYRTGAKLEDVQAANAALRMADLPIGSDEHLELVALEYDYAVTAAVTNTLLAAVGGSASHLWAEGSLLTRVGFEAAYGFSDGLASGAMDGRITDADYLSATHKMKGGQGAAPTVVSGLMFSAVMGMTVGASMEGVIGGAGKFAEYIRSILPEGAPLSDVPINVIFNIETGEHQVINAETGDLIPVSVKKGAEGFYLEADNGAKIPLNNISEGPIGVIQKEVPTEFVDQAQADLIRAAEQRPAIDVDAMPAERTPLQVEQPEGTGVGARKDVREVRDVSGGTHKEVESEGGLLASGRGVDEGTGAGRPVGDEGIVDEGATRSRIYDSGGGDIDIGKVIGEASVSLNRRGYTADSVESKTVLSLLEARLATGDMSPEAVGSFIDKLPSESDFSKVIAKYGSPEALLAEAAKRSDLRVSVRDQQLPKVEAARAEEIESGAKLGKEIPPYTPAEAQAVANHRANVLVPSVVEVPGQAKSISMADALLIHKTRGELASAPEGDYFKALVQSEHQGMVVFDTSLGKFGAHSEKYGKGTRIEDGYFERGEKVTTVDHHGPWAVGVDGKPDPRNTTMKVMSILEEALIRAGGDPTRSDNSPEVIQKAVEMLNTRTVITDNLADGMMPKYIMNHQEMFLNNPQMRQLIHEATYFEDFSAFGTAYNRADAGVELQAALFYEYNKILVKYKVPGSDRFPTEFDTEITVEAFAAIEKMLTDPAARKQTAAKFWTGLDAAAEMAKTQVRMTDVSVEGKVDFFNGKKFEGVPTLTQWLAVPMAHDLSLQVTLAPMKPATGRDNMVAPRNLYFVAIPNARELPSDRGLLSILKLINEAEQEKAEKLGVKNPMPWFGKDNVILPAPGENGDGGSLLTPQELSDILASANTGLFRPKPNAEIQAQNAGIAEAINSRIPADDKGNPLLTISQDYMLNDGDVQSPVMIGLCKAEYKAFQTSLANGALDDLGIDSIEIPQSDGTVVTAYNMISGDRSVMITPIKSDPFTSYAAQQEVGDGWATGVDELPRSVAGRGGLGAAVNPDPSVHSGGTGRSSTEISDAGLEESGVRARIYEDGAEAPGSTTGSSTFPNLRTGNMQGVRDVDTTLPRGALEAREPTVPGIDVDVYGREPEVRSRSSLDRMPGVGEDMTGIGEGPDDVTVRFDDQASQIEVTEGRVGGFTVESGKAYDVTTGLIPYIESMDTISSAAEFQTHMRQSTQRLESSLVRGRLLGTVMGNIAESDGPITYKDFGEVRDAYYQVMSELQGQLKPGEYDLVFRDYMDFAATIARSEPELDQRPVMQQRVETPGREQPRVSTYRDKPGFGQATFEQQVGFLDSAQDMISHITLAADRLKNYSGKLPKEAGDADYFVRKNAQEQGEPLTYSEYKSLLQAYQSRLEELNLSTQDQWDVTSYTMSLERSIESKNPDRQGFEVPQIESGTVLYGDDATVPQPVQNRPAYPESIEGPFGEGQFDEVTEGLDQSANHMVGRQEGTAQVLDADLEPTIGFDREETVKIETEALADDRTVPGLFTPARRDANRADIRQQRLQQQQLHQNLFGTLPVTNSVQSLTQSLDSLKSIYQKMTYGPMRRGGALDVGEVISEGKIKLDESQYFEFSNVLNELFSRIDGLGDTEGAQALKADFLEFSNVVDNPANTHFGDKTDPNIKPQNRRPSYEGLDDVMLEDVTSSEVEPKPKSGLSRLPLIGGAIRLFTGR